MITVNATGINDHLLINAALLTATSSDGLVLAYGGNYQIAGPIAIPANCILQGDGLLTKLDVTSLPTNQASVNMADGSRLRDLLIAGTLPTPYRTQDQDIRVGNNCQVSGVTMTDVAEGITGAAKSGVRVFNCIFKNIRGSNGWSDAINAWGLGQDWMVENIHMENCDRGIEFEDGMKNCIIRSITAKGIKANVGPYNFVFDVHNHTGTPGCENIVYRDCYAEDSGGITCYGADGDPEYGLPKNCIFENIVIKTPWTASSFWGPVVQNSRRTVLRNITFSDYPNNLPVSALNSDGLIVDGLWPLGNNNTKIIINCNDLRLSMAG